MSFLFLAALLATGYPAPVRDTYPVPSPDGTQVAFQSNRNGTPSLWMMRVDGSQLRRLELELDDPSTPDFSPDGTRLLFAARTPGAAEGSTNGVFVLALASGTVTRVPLPAATDIGHPKWMPGGERIVFDSNHATPDPSLPWQQQWQDVYSVRLDGSDLQRHTACRGICTYAQVSPDGTRLVYRKLLAEPGRNWLQGAAEYNSEIFVAKLDGSDARNLSRHAAFDGWPSWGPDGKTVVFASNRDGRPRAASLYLADLETGALRRLGPAQRSFAQPRFAPDGLSVWAYDNIEFVDAEGNDIEIGSIVRLPIER